MENTLFFHILLLLYQQAYFLANSVRKRDFHISLIPY